MSVSTKKAIVGKFKVLRGSHNEGGVTYKRGDMVDSVSDLMKHNKPGCTKFASANDVMPTPQSSDDGLDDLSIDELRELAAEGDLDLTGCGNSKEKIRDRIRASGGI